MAKLKKRLNHEQRKNLTSKQKVAKLTPDEIRSLNHSASVSKSGSVRSINISAQHGAKSTGSGSTPPLTPDNQFLSHQLPPQRQSSLSNLPTPPQSPSRERRGSNSSGRHMHAPKPISHHLQATHPNNNVVAASRSPSANSYRGVETYRGPEITRTGSLTTLQRPSQQIVSNPLSQFSRPRQSTLTTSPTRSRSDSRGNDESIGVPSIIDHRQLAAEALTSQGPSRGESPVRASDSPVSFQDRKMPGLIRIRSKEQVNATDPGTKTLSDNTAQSEHANPGNADPSEAGKHKSWRKTLTGGFEKDPTPLKKETRRRTLMAPTNGYCIHAINYADVKAGNAPEMRDSLKDELPSSKTSIFRDEDNPSDADTLYGQHPAVRPFSLDGKGDASNDGPASIPKGKQREDLTPDAETDSISAKSSVPSYSRCTCCGRVQKQGGFDSELSPVLENENLRTNFNFEAVNTGLNPPRRSSSIRDGPRKYTPIIPMEVGNTTKQARIQPVPSRPASTISAPLVTAAKRTGVTVTKQGDVIGPGSTPLAIMPRKRTDPRLSRFGSLHARIDDKTEDANAQEQASQENLVSTPQLSRFASLHGMRNTAQSNTTDPTAQQPSPNQSAYQTQQVRHYSLPNRNDYRPVRSSRLASYNDNTATTPAEELTQKLPGAFSPPLLEKPLHDSPTSQTPQEANSSEESLPSDDGPMVDLSSFDGSFVDSSLARSATIGKSASPYNPVLSTNNTRPQIEANTSRVLDPAPPRSASMASYTSDDHPVIGQAISAPVPVLSTPTRSAVANFSRPSSRNGRPNSTITTTTVVRIIPSAPLSNSSSTKSVNGGPMKLGDWVLPESPRVASSESSSLREGATAEVAT